MSTGREAKSRPRKAEHPSEDPAPCSTEFFEELRLRYRPKKVGVLLVAESRPAGGTFFYAGNSNLVRYTEQAFRMDAFYMCSMRACR